MNVLRILFIALLASAGLPAVHGASFIIDGTTGTSVTVDYTPPDPGEDMPASLSNALNLSTTDPLSLNGSPTAIVVSLIATEGTRITINPEGLDGTSFGLQVLYRLSSGTLGTINFTGEPAVTFSDSATGGSAVGAPTSFSSYSSSYPVGEFAYVLVGINSTSPINTFSFTGMTVSLSATTTNSSATLHVAAGETGQIFSSVNEYSGPSSPTTPLIQVASVSSVPEPTTTALAVPVVLAGMLAMRRRRLH